MGMRRAKSIDEIYEEVKGYDLVITNDAPLATALDAMDDRPRLGIWAITPQQLARQESLHTLGSPIWSDLRILMNISRETGLDIRLVHGELENLRRMRRYTSRMEDYIHTSDSRRVWNAYNELPTLEKAMLTFDPGILRARRVAVIGLDAFNDLDKHLLPSPDVIHEVDTFIHGDFEPESFWEMGSDRDMAAHVIDLIDESNAEDTAIVMSIGSPVADAVRSALYRKGIPFKNRMELRDTPLVRDYLQFLELSLQFPTLRVRDVSPLLLSLGCRIPDGRDNVRLSTYSRSEDQQLLGIMADIGSFDLGQIAEVVSRGNDPGPIITILEEMDMLHRMVDRESVDIISYAFDAIDHGDMSPDLPDDERHGVVLIDCLNSSYVDRSLIFYLGLNDTWAPPAAFMEYVDVEREGELEEIRFQILLQQGRQRLYLVNSDGGDVPCVLFDRVMVCGKGSPLSFKDLGANGSRPMGWLDRTAITDIGSNPVSEAVMEGIPLSASSLRNFLICPRMFWFSRLVSDSENEHTLFGALIHHFAQFHASYPDLIPQNGLDPYLQIMMDEYASLREPYMSDLDRSRARTAMERIVTFLDSLKIPEGEMIDTIQAKDGTDDDPPWIENPFMRYHGLRHRSACTEVPLSTTENGFRGRLDLLADNGLAVDFKTGKVKPISRAINHMDLESPTVNVDIQPIAYLHLMTENGMQGRRSIVFYYPLSGMMGDGRGSRNEFVYDGEDARSFVKNGGLVRHMRDKKTYDELIGDMDERFERTILETGVIDRDDPWYEDPEVLAAFNDAHSKWKGKKLEQMLKRAYKVLKGPERYREGTFTVLKEDIIRLMDRIESSSTSIKEMLSTGFPGDPIDAGYCSGKSMISCPYADMCIREVRE